MMSKTKSRGCSSALSKTGLQLLLVLASSALFSTVIVYTQVANWALVESEGNRPLNDNLKMDAGTTIAIVRALQGILVATSSITLVRSFTYLFWGMIRRSQGLSYLSLLSISPSTLDLGTLRLILSSASQSSSRLWALLNIFLAALLWISGLVLFFQTSIVVVYDTAQSYDVTAGVGPFNSSYVNDFFGLLQNSTIGYEYQVIPYSYYAVVYNLVINPVFSTVTEPIQCKGTNCASYLFSGGVLMTAPWQPTDYQYFPLIKVPQVPAMQLEFQSGKAIGNYTDAECDNFGGEGVRIGVRVCLSRPENDPEGFEAALFVCKDGVQNGVCITQYPTPNITATIAFYSRAATILSSRSNSSIMSVSDITPPNQIHLSDGDMSAYRAALRWLLDFSAANIPAPSSIVESFWTGRDQLETEPESYGYLRQHFHSILAFPLWLFNANNFGNTDLQSNVISTTLPPQFFTKAHIVTPYTKIKFSQSMVIIFASFQGVVILFTWVVLLWAVFVSDSLPTMSSYPLFDVAFKTEVSIPANQRDIWNADDKEIVDMAKHATVHAKQE